MKYILTVFVSFLCFYASAQQKGKIFVEAAGGVSMPLGNWAKSKDIVSTNGFVNDPSGFAAKAPVFSLDGGYFLSKHIAVGALVSYASYKTKNLSVLSSGYQESFDVDQVTTTAGSYKMLNFLPGLFYDFPLAGRLSLTGRTLIGLSHVKTPRIMVDVVDGGIDDGVFVQKSASATALAFDLGTGLQYRVCKCLSLNLRGDYSYSKPNFTIENTKRSNSAGRLITSYNQPLSSVNVFFGLSYNLGR